MSMHLENPGLTTTSTKKFKTKITKSKQEELEQGHRERNARLKSMGLPKETFDEYMVWIFGKGKKVKSDKTKIYKPEKVIQPSAISRPEIIVKGAISSKPNPIYSGNNIVGISTMHKSSAVPVFSKQEAEDISKMRR